MTERPAWLDEARRPPRSVPADATRPAPPLFDAAHRPVTTPAGWAARRAEIERAWRDFLGTIPDPGPLGPVRTVELDEPGVLMRSLVRYDVEPGEAVEAYVLRPRDKEPAGGRPGVVVLHSTTDDTIRQPAGLAGPEDKHIGVHLARRGYVAVCPRCFLWPDGRGGKIATASALARLRARHPGVTGMAKMLFDARRAVDLLLGLPGVDRDRVGAIGHSLGGKEVLYLAAFDPRVRAAVSSEGGVGLSYSNWDAPWYLGDAIRRPGFPLDHGQVLALAAPRAVLIVGGDSADGAKSWPYVEAAGPVWDLLGAPDAVGLFNHGKGHAFPPEAMTRSAEWLDWFLRPREGAAKPVNPGPPGPRGGTGGAPPTAP